MDLCTEQDYQEQKTPNESQDSGFIRVTHPHHPLYNQIVKVLRRAGNPAYPESCYLIELPDKTRAELLCSWAVPVAQDESAPCSVLPLLELLAGVTEYLVLVRLMQALLATPNSEDISHEPFNLDCTPDRNSGSSHSTMGATSPGMPEGTDRRIRIYFDSPAAGSGPGGENAR